MAYVLSGVKSLTNIVPYHLKIECGDKIIEDDFIWGAISNSTSVGGVLKLDKKNIRIDDGKFEVILLKSPKNPMELQSVLTKLFNQEFDDNFARLLYVDKIKIDNLEIDTEGRIVKVDGIVKTLTNKEYNLLLLLVKNKDIVLV